MRFTKTIASASVAAVLGLAGVSVAGATSNPGSPLPTAATAAATPKAGAAKKAGGAFRRMVRRDAGKIVAKTIGITRVDLLKELRAGKTIADIATEHGVQPQTVITALENAATARINAAVAAGKITAGRGTKLTTRVDKLVPKLVNDWHPKAAKSAAAGGPTGGAAS